MYAFDKLALNKCPQLRESEHGMFVHVALFFLAQQCKHIPSNHVTRATGVGQGALAPPPPLTPPLSTFFCFVFVSFSIFSLRYVTI